MLENEPAHRRRPGAARRGRPSPSGAPALAALAALLVLAPVAAAPAMAEAGQERVPDRILLSVDPEGRIVLRGSVRGRDVQRRAAELAGSVAGVPGVRNDLVIEPGRDDSELVVDSLETHQVIEPRVMELRDDPVEDAGDARETGQADERVRVRRTTCVLSNPRFAGSCIEVVQVEPWRTALEACREVLRCLEDVRCVATFCQATPIRGGWRLELVVGPEERAAVPGE